MMITCSIIRLGRVLPLILLMIMAIPYACNAQDESGEILMSEARELLKDGDDLFKARNYVQARDFYKKALSRATADLNNSDKAEALSMIARTHLVQDDVETGYTWLQKAEKLADNHQPLGWSRYQLVKGRFLWREKKFDEATELFKELYDYCSKRKLYDRAVDAAHMVAITGSLEEQVVWAKKGIKEALAGNITGWLGPLWNNLGVTYEEMEKFDSSLQAYMQAREYHNKYGNDRNKVIADYAVGHALLKLERYKEAGEWLRPVLTKCEQAQDNEFVGLTCRDLSEIGSASGNYQEAYDLMLRARNLLKEAEMDQWDPDGFNQMEEQLKDLKSKID